MNFTQDIADFHEKFDLAYNGPPRNLPVEMQRFRLRFLREELNEYMLHSERLELLDKAGGDKTDEYIREMEGQIDALVDLVYVALGTAYLHGYNFDEAWRRVQEANMKKVRATAEEQSKRGSTLDVVKPDGWVPPDHLDLVMP